MENQKNPDDEISAKLVPPDDQRCRRMSGQGWRCKNILSTSHNPTYLCDYHYNLNRRKNQGRKKKLEQNKKSKHKITGKNLGRPPTHHDSSDFEIGFKRQKIGNTTDCQMKRCGSAQEGKSFGEETKKCESKLEEIFGDCKTRCVELLLAELEKKATECTGLQEKLAESESRKIAAEEELKDFKRRLEGEKNLIWGKKEARTCGRVIYLEEELKKMEEDMEHEKRRAEGEIEFWRNKVVDLEARVLRMENVGVESRILEPRGLQNDGLCNSEMGGDNELRNCDAEFNGGKLCSRACELEAKDKVLNKEKVDMNTHRQVKVEVAECSAMNISLKNSNVPCEGQNVENGSRLERASVHEYSSENRLGLSVKLNDNVGNTAKENSVKLACLDGDVEGVGEASKESSDCSSDSESLGEAMERMAMKYRSEVKEIKWEIEADMLSSFEEDPELCMKAVCALYRQQNFEEKSANGLFHHLDAQRIKTLAEFLMEGDCKGDLKKSVKELEAFTPEELDDCIMLANSYSEQLFSIYKDKRDIFFLPTSTASH